jgi:hypothetical protein
MKATGFKIELDKDILLNMERSAKRQAEIENGLNVNRHRVFKNKKAYSRKEKHNAKDSD